jgi:hypothetical protein
VVNRALKKEIAPLTRQQYRGCRGMDRALRSDGTELNFVELVDDVVWLFTFGD